MKRIRTDTPPRPSRRRAAWLTVLTGLCAVGALAALLGGRLGTLLAPEARAAEHGRQAMALDQPEVPRPVEIGGEHNAAEEPNDSEPVFRPDPLAALADALREREQELERREAELEAEARRLETLRREIEDRLNEVNRIYAEMARMAGQAEEQHRQEISKWIKIYDAMDEQQVAQVLTQLDRDFVLSLLYKFEPKRTAKILENFPPERVVEFARVLQRDER